MNNIVRVFWSALWLAVKVVALLILMKAGQSAFVYQNF